MTTLSLMNRQRAVRVNLSWLRKAGAAALEACLRLPGHGSSKLRTLDEIEVAVISDSAIARVHVDFMGIAGPTDVITFDHGEILVSADTAATCAREHGHTVDEEVALYVIHGILHLAGYDDMTAPERKAMHAVQNRIWRDVRAAIPRT